MSTSVGELFVTLGVKGADKTVQAFSSVKTGISDLGNTSLETKAALVGIFYAFQQLMAASTTLGTNLTTMSTLLGVDVKTLGEYGYAATKAGSSLEDLEGNLKSIQSTFEKINLNKGSPDWLGEIARVTGHNVGQKEINEFAKSPQKFIQLLQEYAKNEKNEAKRNEILGTFVGSDPLKRGIIDQVFNAKNFKEADGYILSDKQAKGLDNVRFGFQKIGMEIEKSIGGFGAKYGKQFIGEMDAIVKSVLNLTDAFLALDKQLPILIGIGKIVGGWVTGINALTTFVKAISGDKDSQKDVNDVLNYGIPGISSINQALDAAAGKSDGKAINQRYPQAGPAPVNFYIQLPSNAKPKDYTKAIEDAGRAVFNQTGTPR